MKYAIVILLLLAACTTTVETPMEPTVTEPVKEVTEPIEEVTEPVKEVTEPIEEVEKLVVEVKPVEPEEEFVPEYRTSFSFTAESYAFHEGFQKNPDIYVKLGEKISIRLDNLGGVHNIVVGDFAASKQIRTGQSTRISFVADKTGTFNYYCSVGNHRAQGMEGKFIVEG